MAIKSIRKAINVSQTLTWSTALRFFIGLALYSSTSSALQLQPHNPLQGLSLAGTQSLFPLKGFTKNTGSNFTEFALAERSSRVKRDMFYFPLGSSLTFQFKLVTPVYSDTSTSLTTDLRLEVKFKLPNRATNGRRKRRSIAEDRSALYRSIIALVDETGLQGRACLQRAVCEAAQGPLIENGLLGEILTLLLTPSHSPGAPAADMYDSSFHESSARNEIMDMQEGSTIISLERSQTKKKLWEKLKRTKLSKVGDRYNRTISRRHIPDIPVNSAGGFDLWEFVQAESYGRDDARCWLLYPNCPVSIREILFDALSTLSKNNHLLVHDEL
ncbi:uncharacterized protein LOC125178982 [Hyalella azteca]|uniref:Uncharacterized protein LOC125178982 n=1 Tax=Hyalella azteca TaxID=294128 RepID=A0A979FU19_HYAAZ|nr:uncharacterized protein LOC125178982 [Hyalella azteca]